MTNRPTSSNFGQELDDGHTSSHSAALAESQETFSVVDGNVQSPATFQDEEEEDSELVTSHEQAREQRPCTTRKRKADVNELLMKTLERHEKRATERERDAAKKLKVSDPHKDEELFQFFMSMYNTTKKMPPIHQLKLKKAIFNAVTNKEELLMTFNVASGSSYNSTPEPSAFSPGSNVSNHSDSHSNSADTVQLLAYHQTSLEMPYYT